MTRFNEALNKRLSSDASISWRGGFGALLRGLGQIAACQAAPGSARSRPTGGTIEGKGLTQPNSWKPAGDGGFFVGRGRGRRAIGILEDSVIAQLTLCRRNAGTSARCPLPCYAISVYMAIVCKSPDQILSEPADVGLQKLHRTTEDDIRRHMIEDGEDPDAALADYKPNVLPTAVRQKLGLTQEAFATLLRIPIGTIRNWEQNRVKPDPAARALLLILYRQPAAALEALRAA